MLNEAKYLAKKIRQPHRFEPTEEDIKQEDDIVLVCEFCDSESVALAIESVQCHKLLRFIQHPARLQLK